MSNQRRFEGTDLEALLDEVRGALGDEVHIVAANRVRKGGVGGFFAREYFEVIAEEPDVAIDLRPAVRLGRRRRGAAQAAGAEVMNGSRSVPLSVLDLVEERNAEERALASHDFDEPSIAVAHYADGHVGDRQYGDRYPNEYVDDAYADEAYADDTYAANAPNTSGATWSNSDGIYVEQPPPYTPMPEIAFAAPAVAQPINQPVNEPLVSATEAPRVSTETERFAQILERLAHTTEHRTEAPPAPATAAEAFMSRAAAPAPEPVIERAPEPVVSLIDAERAEPRPAPSPAAAPAPHVTAPAATQAPSSSAVEETIERPEHMLVRLGLPARFVPRGVTGNALRDALVESLGRLPRTAALPNTKGVVVAIVGIGARPLLLGRSVSEELGLDPDEVVVATQSEIDGVPAWLQITDPEAADERRRSWRRREQLTFVAISQPSLTAATNWASDMLDRLEPTQLWSLASAGWKPEDVDAWSRRLGGFDLVALDRLVDTVSPASMLSLGLPIGRLDGAAATPECWADLLLDRIADHVGARA